MNILGEGVDAINKDVLLSEISSVNTDNVKNINTDLITIGKYQPRTTVISNDSLNELKESIIEQGVLQPIIVREDKKGNYELIAGERRYRASCLAGIKTIPCIIKNVTPTQAFAIAIVENIQRKQLTTLEEAEALLRLKDEYGFTNEETAKSITRPRTTVTNLIRLAEKLSPFGKKLLISGIAEFGHARAVLSMPYDAQDGLLSKLLEKKISVRALEKIINTESFDKKLSKPLANYSLSCHELNIVGNNFFSREVKVKKNNNGSIKLTVEFKDEDSLRIFLRGDVLL